MTTKLMFDVINGRFLLDDLVIITEHHAAESFSLSEDGDDLRASFSWNAGDRLPKVLTHRVS